MITWKAAALSDQGVKRQDNQDNFFISDDQRLFVVADGMGGALGGATASKLTVEAIGQRWNEAPPQDQPDQIKTWLEGAIELANETVFNHSSENPAVQGMGTTVVAAVQGNNGSVYIAHVGDSRAYRIRQGKAEALTQDHSLVMELFRSGHITEAQMKESPFKSYITRCIGHKNKVEVDLKPADVKAEDWILLCTDGLTAVLQDDAIGDTVDEMKEPEAACQKLVELTIAGGAPDNVTVIAIKYGEGAGDNGARP